MKKEHKDDLITTTVRFTRQMRAEAEEAARKERRDLAGFVRIAVEDRIRKTRRSRAFA
ncbi:MAG: hypothetical protein M3167_06220 [Acidobacteriota bacterium]|nr:hypothetical protein [Acidobacteriota bacterium]MDQ6892260.1 hypothetical protein [Acidobacteriota bacterium]